MSDETRLWILMGKKLSGAISATEDRELDKLFQEYPDVWYNYELLTGLDERESIPGDFLKEVQALIGYTESVEEVKTVEAIDEKKAVYSSWVKLAVAAVVAAGLLGVGIIGYNHLQLANKAAKQNNEIIAVNGTKADIDLPDGSRVMLNSGSKLTYGKTFASANIREVFLSGEGYFKVVHDAQHPFIIHTARFDVRDIGTTFNVKAYPGEKVTEASLIEGAIEISFKNSSTGKVMLRPKQKIVLLNSGPQNTRTTSVIDGPVDYKVAALAINKDIKNGFEETAWIDNELIFNNDLFEDLAKKMERRYNVEITFADDKIKQLPLTGTFQKENISQALKTLQEISSFKYRIDHDKITIWSSEKNK